MHHISAFKVIYSNTVEYSLSHILLCSLLLYIFILLLWIEEKHQSSTVHLHCTVQCFPDLVQDLGQDNTYNAYVIYLLNKYYLTVQIFYIGQYGNC